MNNWLFVSRKLAKIFMPTWMISGVDAIFTSEKGAPIGKGDLYFRTTPAVYGAFLRSVSLVEKTDVGLARQAMLELRPVYEWLVDAFLADEFTPAAQRGKLTPCELMDMLASDIAAVRDNPSVTLPRPAGTLSEVAALDRIISDRWRTDDSVGSYSGSRMRYIPLDLPAEHPGWEMIYADLDSVAVSIASAEELAAIAKTKAPKRSRGPSKVTVKKAAAAAKKAGGSKLFAG